jgi:hypothetical protein
MEIERVVELDIVGATYGEKSGMGDPFTDIDDTEAIST